MVVVPPHSGAKADHIPGPILPSASLGNLRSQLVLTSYHGNPMQLPPSSSLADLALPQGLGAGRAVEPSVPFLVPFRYTARRASRWRQAHVVTAGRMRLLLWCCPK